MKNEIRFKSKKQLAEWIRYLDQRGETHQEALMNLIDTAIKHNKDLNKHFEKITGETK